MYWKLYATSFKLFKYFFWILKYMQGQHTVTKKYRKYFMLIVMKVQFELILSSQSC